MICVSHIGITIAADCLRQQWKPQLEYCLSIPVIFQPHRQKHKRKCNIKKVYKEHQSREMFLAISNTQHHAYHRWVATSYSDVAVLTASMIIDWLYDTYQKANGVTAVWKLHCSLVKRAREQVHYDGGKKWATKGYVRCIESIKTTSMEDVSTRVLEKNKEYLRR